MTNVTGKAYQTTNIRSAAKVVDKPTNVIGKMLNSETFTGAIVMSAGEKWIKLATVNGKAVTGEQYVASWVVNFDEVVTAPPAEDDPIIGANVIYASGKVVSLVPMP